MPGPVTPFAAYEPDPSERPGPVDAVLEQAGVEDIGRLAAVQAGVRGGPAEQWSGRIARALGGEHGEHRVVVLARVGAEVAAYANAAYLAGHPEDGAPGGYYLTGVTVAQRWRRRGLGGLLTRWRMDWVWEREQSVWCFVSSQNRASLDLHRRLGFEVVRSARSLQGVSFDSGEGILLNARRGRSRIPQIGPKSTKG